MIEVKDINQYKLSGFTGVDFTSSPLNVKERRSPDATNWVFDHGRPVKRNGWKQIAYVGDYKVNSMIEYATNTILVHAGVKFYKVVLTTTGVGYTLTEVTTTGLTITDTPSQIFIQDDRYFIVGAGDFFVWHKPDADWVLESVFNNEITYIPTTTISIDYEGYEGVVLRATLERPSLMTEWRINTARGVDEVATERTYLLDGNVDMSYDAATDVLAYITITNEGGTDELYGFYDDEEERINILSAYGVPPSYGYIEADGTMVLEYDTIPPTNDDNIIIKFKGYNGDEYASGNISNHVRASAFGTLFGVDGVTSQLFVSGADIPSTLTIKNVDFYSYPLDFTYWPDNFYRTVGNSAITGYHRIADGSLVIFKAKANQEAAIFLRTGTLETVTDDGYYNAEIVYTEKAGFASDYLTSRRAIATLEGDPLYITETGVKGIALSENVSTDERYARRRSTLVDKKLTALDTTSAISIVYDDRYYLCIDGECFIADARLRFGEGGEIEYEWMYWDNIPATRFYERNNDLWFGTADGRICVFDSEFTDREFEAIDSADLSFHAADDEVVYSVNVDVEDGDIIKFAATSMHELVMDSTDTTRDTNVITAVSDEAKARLLLMSELEEMLLLKADESSITAYAQNVDYGTYSFEVVDEDGVAVDMSLGYDDYWFIKPLAGVELFARDVEEDSFKLERYKDTLALSMTYYHSGELDDTKETNVGAIIITKTNVTATWYSKIADLGTSVFGKTLLSLTLVAEGEMTFGYVTRLGDLAREYEKSGGFDFTDFDFTNFTFTAFTESITKKIKERNINYVMFKIESTTGKTAAINEIVVRYKFQNMNKGVQ